MENKARRWLDHHIRKLESAIRSNEFNAAQCLRDRERYLGMVDDDKALLRELREIEPEKK